MMNDTNMTARAVIERLGLEPHPEGGHYLETWRDPDSDGARGHGTAIYYLLAAGEESAWHRVDAVEIWHFYAGAPLALEISLDATVRETLTLGSNLLRGEHLQVIVPKLAWQRARSLGDWTLAGCTVSPAFRFAGFELAPKGFEPG
jgi:predicted cupin superfamily sugar epimerase